MQGLKREILEELKVECKIDRLLWVIESMFYLDSWKSDIHELAFYYLINIPENSSIYGMDSFYGTDYVDGQNIKLKFKLFLLNELNSIKFLPGFLQKELLNIPLTPKHIIVNELS